MTRHKALQKARAHARRYRHDRYVVTEGGEFFHCSEYDLGTWHLGAKVIALFDGSGREQ